MKKFIITVLVVVLVFSMTACASKKHISIDKSLLSDIQSTSNEDDLTAYNSTENNATANTDETTEITTSDITDSSSTETKHTSGENTAINSSSTV